MQVLQPGQLFAGRYRVERLLAQGGFGAVFIAEQLATEMRVALKVLWPHVLGSQDAVEKFQLEARVAARVNSEYIVKVFDAGFDEATKLPFLAMELLEGETLDQYVIARGPLSPADAYRYLAQVALGLDRAHGYVDREGRAKPIVHRDLKPENLFLARRENGENVVKILDFGIAKVLSSTSHVSQEVKGTPLYMAHEQAAGKAVSPRTDVWALGLIAFHILSARSYWRTASNPDGGISALFGEILSLPLDPPTQRLRELGAAPPWPPTFDAWFSRCVTRNVEERFATAGEAIGALGVALGVTASNSLPRSLATGAGIAGTLPSASVPTAQAVTAGAMSVSGVGAPRKSRGKGLLIALVALLGLGGVAAALTLGRSGPSPALSSEPPPAAAAAPQTGPTVAPVAPAPPEPVAPPSDTASSAPAVSAAPAPVSPPTVAAQAPAARPRPVAAKAPAAAPAKPAPAVPATRPKNDVYGER
jgi:serine/threonine-protein kinase